MVALPAQRSGAGSLEVLFLRRMFLRIGVVIPTAVRRKGIAAKAGGISPLVSATGTYATGPEGVPFRSAVVPRAAPQIMMTWTPFAFGTEDLRLRHRAFLGSDSEPALSQRHLRCARCRKRYRVAISSHITSVLNLTTWRRRLWRPSWMVLSPMLSSSMTSPSIRRWTGAIRPTRSPRPAMSTLDLKLVAKRLRLERLVRARQRQRRPE